MSLSFEPTLRRPPLPLPAAVRPHVVPLVLPTLLDGLCAERLLPPGEPVLLAGGLGLPAELAIVEGARLAPAGTAVATPGRTPLAVVAALGGCLLNFRLLHFPLPPFAATQKFRAGPGMSAPRGDVNEAVRRAPDFARGGRPAMDGDETP